MVIEFRCPHCSKSLKTGDEKAGKRAKCPGCGDVVTVPGGSSDGASRAAPAMSDALARESGDEYALEEPVADQPSRPPRGEPTQPCPMCGATILASATRCRSCGENFRPGGEPGQVVPTRIAAMDVLSYAWRLYREHTRTCVVIALVPFCTNVFAGMIRTQLESQMKQPGGGAPGLIAMIAFGNLFLTLFLNLGSNKALLKIAKGGTAEVAEVFSGGRFLVRAIGMMFLAGLAAFGASMVFIMAFALLTSVLRLNAEAQQAVSLVATLIGALAVGYLILRLTPASFCLVDQDCGPLQALKMSWSITQGNALQLLMMGFVAVLSVMLGVVACCIGAIATFPYALLLQAAAYVCMSGQIAPVNTSDARF